jgi:hypothetical protein
MTVCHERVIANGEKQRRWSEEAGGGAGEEEAKDSPEKEIPLICSESRYKFEMLRLINKQEELPGDAFREQLKMF